MMQTINLEECDVAVQKFVELLENTKAIILLQGGKPRYVFGGIDDFEWEVFSLSRNQAFMEYLEQARQRAKREGTISIEKVRRRLGISSETNDNSIAS